MAKINIRESLGRLDILTDNKYDLRNTYDCSNISNDKKKKLAESLNNNASAKQLYSILNESFEEPGVNVTEEMSDTIRTGMLSGMVGNDIWEVFFESGPTDVLDSDLEDISDDVFNGKLSGKTSRGIGWQIRVGYNDDYYDYNCLNCPDDDYVGNPWEIYDESLTEDTIKQNGKWVNKGSEGTHGKFRTKKAADAQRKAMFAQGFKGESLEESVEDGYMKHADVDARKVKSLYRKNKDIDSVFSSLGYADNGDGSYEKEVEDNVFIVFEYDKDSERLEYKVVNEETRTGTPSNVLSLSKKLKERVQRVSASKYNSPVKEFDWDSDGSGRYYVTYHPKDGTGGCDADVYSDWRQKGRYVLDRIDGNNVGKGKLTKAEVQNLIRQYCSNGGLDEDWEPDAWEETDFLDNDGKKVYINIIKEAEDIDDLKDIVHDLYWHDKGLFAMLRHFPKDKSFEWIQNRMIEVIKSTMNESLTEASYGGAYDIEDDMFWTKDDLIEFSDAVCEKLADKFGYQYDIADVGAESNNDMYITIMDTTHDIEADVSFRIKMSRIRSPKDLMKYLDTVVSQFVKKFEEEYQYYDFDESLKEDVSKPDFVLDLYAVIYDEDLNEKYKEKFYELGFNASDLRSVYGNVVDTLLNKYTKETSNSLLGSENGNELSHLIHSAWQHLDSDGKIDDLFEKAANSISSKNNENIHDVYIDTELKEINYPFESGIKKLSKHLGKVLLPKRENLKEDVYDEESDFGDGSVEEGDTFIEDGRTWSWIERIAGPIHLDFDNWAVWSARDWDYIEEKVKPLLINKEDFNVEVLTKIYDEAEVAYFVVDEDTGFVGWGPVKTQTEAQDFLNSKVEDYENDEYDESLKESKQLKESSDITDNGYSYTLHYEDIGDGREYDYEVSSDEMFDFLNITSWENGDGPEDMDMEDHEQWDNWVADNIDELIKKYEDDILDHFKEDASQEEYDNRDPDDRYDPYKEIGMKPSDFY